MSEKYDLIFSLGATPLTAELLKKLDLQVQDFPFDLISGSDFLTKMSMFINGCRDFMAQSNLKDIGENPITKNKQYQDIKTNFIYAYDFNPTLPIENTYPAVKTRYNKYIKNLYLYLKHSKKTLIVYIEDPTRPEEDNDSLIMEATLKLREIYPKSEINILYAKNDSDSEDMKVIKINKSSYKFIFKFYGQFVEGLPKIIDESMVSIIFEDIELKQDWTRKKIFFIKKIIAFLDKIISKN